MKNSKGKRSLVELISYDHIVEGGYVCDFFKKAAGPDPRVGNQVIDCGSNTSQSVRIANDKKLRDTTFALSITLAESNYFNIKYKYSHKVYKLVAKHMFLRTISLSNEKKLQ